MSFIVQFNLESPLILRHRLHLESIFGSLLGGLSDIPLCRHVSGVFRASQSIYFRPQSPDDILPQDRILNITDLSTRYYLVHEAPLIPSMPAKPHFAIKSDTFKSYNVHAVRFLAETEDPDALKSLAQSVPAIGKWSRKGNGTVKSCALIPFHGDVWSLEGRVTRAMPKDLAKSLGLQGIEALEVCRPPYFSGDYEPAIVPTVDPSGTYFPRLRPTSTPSFLRSAS